MKKFKPIDLPYIFKLTNNNKNANKIIYNLNKLDSKSNDTLFLKEKDINEIYCFGYLTDTSKFYSLIYLYPSDNFYPVLVTYTKEGKRISQSDLFANGSSEDCGLKYFSINCVIQKDYSIFCSDTVVWEYFCNENGPIPNTAETWIYIKKGKVFDDGKISIDKTQQLTIKNNP